MHCVSTQLDHEVTYRNPAIVAHPLLANAVVLIARIELGAVLKLLANVQLCAAL